MLGRLLGAEAKRFTEDGAPDGFWRFGDWHSFVFEAKTDEAEEGGISLNEAEGTEGAIDFALGDYLSPSIGIELSMKESWSHNEAVYDYLKLLDGKNKSFKHVVSLNVLMRRAKKLSQAGRRENIYQAMKNDLSAAKLMLTDSPCPADRQCVFIVTEIAQQDRRHWYWDEARQDFISTVDVPLVLKVLPRQG
jgi:hypothetical protein